MVSFRIYWIWGKLSLTIYNLVNIKDLKCFEIDESSQKAFLKNYYKFDGIALLIIISISLFLFFEILTFNIITCYTLGGLLVFFILIKIRAKLKSKNLSCRKCDQALSQYDFEDSSRYHNTYYVCHQCKVYFTGVRSGGEPLTR